MGGRREEQGAQGEQEGSEVGGGGGGGLEGGGKEGKGQGQGQRQVQGEEGEKGEEKVQETGEEKLARASEVLKGLRLREIWKSVQDSVGDRARLLSGQTQSQSRSQSQAQIQTQQSNPSPLQQEGQPKITLRGLSCMQAATPEAAAVLYAPPADELGLLQRFCERVRDAFREADVMADEGRPLLLHATVVNTVYVKGDKGRDKGETSGGLGGEDGGGRGGRGRGRGGNRARGGRGGGRGGKRWERLVFDAREVLERYEDQVWMRDVPLESVAICKMGAKKVVVDGVEDEAYEVASEVEF